MYGVMYLFGEKDAESRTIAMGVHKYNFSVLIPPTAPYSIEGSHGYVRYRIDANLDIPWDVDLHTEAAFRVVRPLDLNLFPMLKTPVNAADSIVISYCCCQDRPIHLVLQLPKQGYAVGETIEARVVLDNRGSHTFYKSSLSLEKLFTYIAEGHSHEECIRIAYKPCQGVNKRERVTYTEDITIPHDAPTSTKNFCQAFNVSYRLRLSASIDGFASNPNLYAPIFIGNVGFKNEPNSQPFVPVARAPMEAAPLPLFVLEVPEPGERNVKRIMRNS